MLPGPTIQSCPVRVVIDRPLGAVMTDERPADDDVPCYVGYRVTALLAENRISRVETNQVEKSEQNIEVRHARTRLDVLVPFPACEVL